ncbi:type VI secretion system baseplate subunit TssG [Yoonia sp. SS1-5]|uniref:Type VI secretion system baseplate subunit TssG n=1 Tax=Yoonia rhodophyticola TaxID=3137370 RepID=A0AAN0NLZ1_9RHOB
MSAPEQEPRPVGYLALLRKLERESTGKPRIGKNTTLSEEVATIGQDPFLAFPASDMSDIRKDKAGRPDLRNQIIGFFGPHGALPLNTTEEVLRWAKSGDLAFVKFTDLFATRFQQLFFRAWSDARAITQFDHEDDDSFSRYVGALIGIGTPAWKDRGVLSDTKRYSMVSLGMGRVKSPVRLRQMLRYDLGADITLDEHAPTWIMFEADGLNRLGMQGSTIGRDCFLGSRAQSVNEKIVIRIKAKTLDEYRDFLPGGMSHTRMRDIVGGYLGRTFEVAVSLSLPSDEFEPAIVGKSAELGWMATLSPNPEPPPGTYLPGATYTLSDAA